jgi:hypothetical protein
MLDCLLPVVASIFEAVIVYVLAIEASIGPLIVIAQLFATVIFSDVGLMEQEVMGPLGALV